MRLLPLAFMCAAAAISAQSVGDALRNRITETANRYLGVPYVYGAESPKAFDCSGFVHYVYKTAAQLDLPRNSKQQWAAGMPIKLSDAQPGDVVVFDTTGAGGPSHVALFLGDGKVIHAISDGPKTGVVITQLSKSRAFNSPLGYRLFLAPVSVADRSAQEAAAAKAAQEAAAKAAQEAQAAKAAQEAAAASARQAEAARAAQEAADRAAQEAHAAAEAKAAKAAQEAAAKAEREAAAKAAAEAEASRLAQEAAARSAAEALAAQAAQEAAAKASREAQAAQAAQGPMAPKSAQAAPAQPEGPPIAQIGFDIPAAKTSFTDKIPAATGTGLAFTLRNATGKDGKFTVIFYKTAINFRDSKEIHREFVEIKKGGAIEIPPYVFTEAGIYKLIVKDNWNTQLIERIFKVIERE